MKILDDILAAIKANKSFEDILSVDELVRYTGLSQSYIYKLTSQRILPHYKPQGKTIFFKRSEIDEWILSHPVPPIRNIGNNLQSAPLYTRHNDKKRRTV